MNKLTLGTAILFISMLTYGQVQNTSFETTIGPLPKSWKVVKVDAYDIKIDSGKSHSGENSLLLSGKKLDDKSFQSFSQSVAVSQDKLQKVRITGYIKSENAIGNAGLWSQLRDKDDTIIEFARSDFNDKVEINQDWRKYSIEFLLDSNVKTIIIGGLLSGQGKVWFDDFNIEYLPFSDKQPSGVSKRYIDEFTKIVKSNSIFSDMINWDELQANVNQVSKGMETVDDTGIAIQYILKKLKDAGDNHSFILSAEVFKDKKAGATAESAPSSQLVNGDIGYLIIPGFPSLNKEVGNSFAEKIQNMIKKLDSENEMKGWIVDLRQNTGGNMFPMITGLGPLVGEGELGYFVAKDKKTSWSYQNGRSRDFSVESPYTIKNINNRIALLVGPKTASSGEATAISFIGKKNVKLFGQPTAGYTSANGTFKLSDGKALLLAVSYEMDRTGQEYRSKINPDVLVEPSDKEDTALTAAINWITE